MKMPKRISSRNALLALVIALAGGVFLIFSPLSLGFKQAWAARTLPDYLVSRKDPVSGLSFTRITKMGAMGNGVACGKACSHRYSSAQAWNADLSLLVIANDCSGLCFLDGKTYLPLFSRMSGKNCEWLPRDPERMACIGDKDISLWSPRADRWEKLYTSSQYRDMQFGPGKGNPSDDGRMLAVRAERLDGKVVAFAYDLARHFKYPDIELSRLAGTNEFCSITPLGQRVICFQLSAKNLETYVFSVQGELLQHWKEHHRPAHGDLTVDADGHEIIVGISKSDPDKYMVIKRRLIDGVVTKLMDYGEASHVSLRAISRKGWAIVTYEGDPLEIARHPSWAPYGRQIIALALDGSGHARVIAETNNIRGNYDSETHASASPDGSRIIWSSDWGDAKGPVYDFVTEVSWPQDGNM